MSCPRRPSRSDLASIRALASRLYRDGHSAPHLVLVESYADARRPASCARKYNLPPGTWTRVHGRRNFGDMHPTRTATTARIARHERQGFHTPADRRDLYGDTCSGFNASGRHALA